MRQLSLLNFKDYYDECSYVDFSGNLQSLLNMTRHCVIIFGPKGYGKTHLANIWSKKRQAHFLKPPYLSYLQNKNFIIEDIDKIETEHEENLFHCYNHTKNIDSSILITSSVNPFSLDIKLPDLKSRIFSSHAIELKKPNDEALKSILIKFFKQRNIKIKKDIVEYIINTSERSITSLKELVIKIDECVQTKSISEITKHVVKLAYNMK